MEWVDIKGSASQQTPLPTQISTQEASFGLPDFGDVSLDPDCEDMFDTQYSQSQPIRNKKAEAPILTPPPVVVTATIVPSPKKKEAILNETISTPITPVSREKPPMYYPTPSQTPSSSSQYSSSQKSTNKRPNAITSELNDSDTEDESSPTTLNVQITLNLPKVRVFLF